MQAGDRWNLNSARPLALLAHFRRPRPLAAMSVPNFDILKSRSAAVRTPSKTRARSLISEFGKENAPAINVDSPAAPRKVRHCCSLAIDF